jgi:hypothetical protein
MQQMEYVLINMQMEDELNTRNMFCLSRFQLIWERHTDI